MAVAPAMPPKDGWRFASIMIACFYKMNILKAFQSVHPLIEYSFMIKWDSLINPKAILKKESLSQIKS